MNRDGIRGQASRAIQYKVANPTALGFSFEGTKICWSEKTMARFQWAVERLTNRNWGVSMHTRLTKLADYLRGWMGHFWTTKFYKPIPDIGSWLRRRVRMCFWVQWRRPWRRIGNLLKLGVGKRQAVSTGESSHGPWPLARTYATQLASPKDWLARQGLISFRVSQVSFAYPR